MKSKWIYGICDQVHFVHKMIRNLPKLVTPNYGNIYIVSEEKDEDGFWHGVYAVACDWYRGTPVMWSATGQKAYSFIQAKYGSFKTRKEMRQTVFNLVDADIHYRIPDSDMIWSQDKIT